jgi:hypothetical protein
VLSFDTLIGESEADVVLEGEQVGEFADMMDRLRAIHGRDAHDTVETRHVRQAKRIVGRHVSASPLDSGERIGHAAGREWRYEF